MLNLLPHDLVNLIEIAIALYCIRTLKELFFGRS